MKRIVNWAHKLLPFKTVDKYLMAFYKLEHDVVTICYKNRVRYYVSAKATLNHVLLQFKPKLKYKFFFWLGILLSCIFVFVTETIFSIRLCPTKSFVSVWFGIDFLSSFALILPEIFFALHFLILFVFISLNNKLKSDSDLRSTLLYGLLLITLLSFSFRLYYEPFNVYPIFNKLMVIDPISSGFKIYLIIITFLALWLLNSEGYKTNLISRWEIQFVLIFITFFLIFLTSVTDFFLMFIAISSISLGMYSLFYCSGTEYKSAGILSYFIMHALSTGIFLYAFYLLIISYHYTNFFDIKAKICLNVNKLDLTNNYIVDNISYNEQRVYLVFTILFTLAFSFFLGIFIGSYYVIQMFKSLPYSINLYIICAIKITLFLSFFRVSTLCFNFVDLIFTKNLIVSLAILSILLGSIGALNTKEVRPFFAFAGINQGGFILLALMPTYDPTNELVLLTNGIIFLGVYGLTMSGLLFYLAKVNPKCMTRFMSIEHPVYLNIFISVILLSLAGFPPFLGSIVKYSIVLNLIKSYPILGLVVLGTSLVSWFYYLRFIILFWYKSYNSTFVVTKSKFFGGVSVIMMFFFFLNIFFWAYWELAEGFLASNIIQGFVYPQMSINT
jgi:NADH:ubiquinone oxidoreductase subunit 2 (subunit N)